MPGSGLPSMSEKSCTIRTRKFLTNRLLARRQFVSCCLILMGVMYCIMTLSGKCMKTSSMFVLVVQTLRVSAAQACSNSSTLAARASEPVQHA